MIVFHRNILEFLAICRRENDDIPWDGMLLEFQGLMLTCQRRPCCQFPGFWKIKTPNALACIMPTINWDMENPPFMDQIWRNRRFSINKCLCSVYVSMFSMCIYIYISMFFYIYICLPKAFHIFMCSSFLADPLARTVERRTSNLGVLRHPRADWSRFLGSRCKIDLFSMENMVVCSYIYIWYENPVLM